MGGAVSAGVDNDELIDNLLEADYIKSAAVERVFRAVDRGHYFTDDYKERAYRDTAWKFGNLHISAPCIYSRVMENLKLGPGMSFLNLGSGTGYLSTMAGLILGSNGINHGVEIHEDVINYATEKLEEFILTSSAVDEYEFCPPKFVCGNCLALGSGCRQYDRVYCGAACPENHEGYMKNLIKVGGILVMPINDQLLQIHRTSDTNWESKSVLPVSFATLVSGKFTECSEPLKIPDEEPLSLQDICRFVVRSILRRNIDVEHPELKRPTRMPRKKVKKKNFRKLVIFNSNSDGEEDQNPLQPPTLRNSRGFVMDVDNVETCGSLIEWQILQDPISSSDVFEPICSTDTNTENTSSSDVDSKIDSDSSITTESSSETIFGDGSDDEFLSDFEELHNLLARGDGEVSAAESTSDGVVEKQSGESSAPPKENDKQEGESSTKEKTKREKMDSGIVIDIDAGKEGDFDSDDEEKIASLVKKGTVVEITQPKPEKDEKGKKSGNSTSPPSPEVNATSITVNNYTTYMKEKIKTLPLPMTLKYFLNLNREL